MFSVLGLCLGLLVFCVGMAIATGIAVGTLLFWSFNAIIFVGCLCACD